MKVHKEELTDVTRYIESHKTIELDDMESDFKLIMDRITEFKPVNGSSEILEVGIGTGWFPILCKKKGLRCRGMEISPQLVEYAKEFGRRHGIEPDVELGNIEETDIGESRHDFIIATSTFEHVENWRMGLERICRALKPGGLFYFYSSNKFALKSHEFDFPLYGWLPDSWRYRLRVSRQGEDIMNLGIDFNQFTFVQLRRFFKRQGYSSIYDRLDIFCRTDAGRKKPTKRKILSAVNHIPPLKQLALLFASGTLFICIK